ncbi:hypothetical protein LTR56_018558 [Elasticomyces elasticus]|nr:hypothetical protein LTR56_018558 [Elasticomyces elasticus]KAK3660252.1 hypothetical protein LTR22_008077 [Elasticomyces elasticus]KAK4933676.1 hypothetical protein LTR49_000141 [Elasticomyces elasticus]KAK5761632.1 hypothetical protein LTS12_008236 [Elasticomyces elasticus]
MAATEQHTRTDIIAQQQPTTYATQQQYTADGKVEQQLLVANADGSHDTNTTAGASDDEEWRNGICSHICGADDCDSCLASWFCACFMFGRVDYRLKRFPSQTKDDFDLCNSACGMLCLSFYVHLGCVPVLLMRQELRKKFGIKGNSCTDCLAGWCCLPCTIGQMNTELKDRAAQPGRKQGKAVQYAQERPAMAYLPAM